MRLEGLAFLFAAVAGGPGGCSSGSAAPADAGVDSPIVGCLTDPRDDTYTANLQKVGKAGRVRFSLVSSDPAPPAIGSNTWILSVSDASGQPLPDVTITSIKPFMPDHGHGTSATPVATPNPDGTFTIKPLYLFMAGLWQITITVQSGSVTDSVVYSFCVAG